MIQWPDYISMVQESWLTQVLPVIFPCQFLYIASVNIQCSAGDADSFWAPGVDVIAGFNGSMNSCPSRDFIGCAIVSVHHCTHGWHGKLICWFLKGTFSRLWLSDVNESSSWQFYVIRILHFVSHSPCMGLSDIHSHIWYFQFISVWLNHMTQSRRLKKVRVMGFWYNYKIYFHREHIMELP